MSKWHCVVHLQQPTYSSMPFSFKLSSKIRKQYNIHTLKIIKNISNKRETSSTAFSRRRSDNLSALISACASPSSRSLSTQKQPHHKNTQSNQFKPKFNQQTTYTHTHMYEQIKHEFLTSNFILQSIELDFHRIGTVHQAHKIIRIQTWRPHRRSPPRRTPSFSKRSRHC